MLRKLLPLICCCFFFEGVQSQHPVSKDSLLKRQATSPSSWSGKVYHRVDVEAEFKGGTEGWRKYLEKRLDPLVPVKKNAAPGRYVVTVKFIVGDDGIVMDMVPETRHGYGMEEEVVRIIKKGPPWVPARVNGKPVNAYRRQQVTFIVGSQ